MPIEKLPSGTHGARTPPKALLRLLMPIMERFHRRHGDRFRGGDLLYLTTIGAKTGRRRTNPVARFDNPSGGWLVVASYGGAAQHPGWYHNAVAQPDQVWAEVDGVVHHVEVEQVGGAEYDDIWQTITAEQPSFDGYRARTDRHIPVLRLTSGT
jgi:deazaflavin-dependent oxidoreductase (nitroreductase family)